MRTLRADLAAAARDARTESRAAGLTVRADSQVEARVRLHEAESAIAQFRSDLRSDLRAEVAEGRLSADTVDLIRTRLNEVRRDVVASLRSGG